MREYVLPFAYPFHESLRDRSSPTLAIVERSLLFRPFRGIRVV